MTNSSFLKRTIFALFALSAVLFVSCDDDFNLLGADVVGDDIHSDMIKELVDVVAYDRPVGAVQSNNMLENQLGIYDNPVFGKTVSHFVTQIAMVAENPTLYKPLVDSVYMYIPYYSSAEKGLASGETLYKLDPAYMHGDTLTKFSLQMYRNGYFLRDSDPAATDNIQRYYSDDRAMVENLKVGAPLYDGPEFNYSAKEIEIRAKFMKDGVEVDKLIERKTPGMLVSLDTITMKQIFLSDANKSNLLNNNIFKDYFRGLYFKVTQTGGAVMNTPRFSEGIITFKIHDYETRTDGVAGPNLDKPRISKTITFNLKGNTINFFENTYNPAFNTGVATSDVINGDNQLFLKGGAGSMAVINLDPAKINELQALYVASGKNMLVNEANLVFYVDKNAMGNSDTDIKNTKRIYLYDLKNRRPIIDYSMDATTNSANAKGNKKVYGGILDTVNYRYTIRVTNHIKNIMKGDSTNVKLGLVVTDNINVIANYKLKTPFTEGDTDVKEIPYSSVQSLFGTVLMGSAADVPEDKRIKLEIFYTKPKQ